MNCWWRMQILYALVEQALQSYDVEQFGVAQYLYTTGAFWFTLLACALVSFGHRLLERGYVWLFRPQVCPSHLHQSVTPSICNTPPPTQESQHDYCKVHHPGPQDSTTQSRSGPDVACLPGTAAESMMPGRTRPTHIHMAHRSASGPLAATWPTPLFWELSEGVCSERSQGEAPLPGLHAHG